jgi:hypothetical protein
MNTTTTSRIRRLFAGVVTAGIATVALSGPALAMPAPIDPPGTGHSVVQTPDPGEGSTTVSTPDESSLSWELLAGAGGVVALAGLGAAAAQGRRRTGGPQVA